MDLQPDTFACFGVHRTKSARISSLRIRTLLNSIRLHFDLSHKTCARLLCSCLFHVQRVPSAFTRRLSIAYSTFGLLHARFRPGRVPGERVPSSHVIAVVALTPRPTSTPCTWSGHCPACFGLATALASGGGVLGLYRPSKIVFSNSTSYVLWQ